MIGIHRRASLSYRPGPSVAGITRLGPTSPRKPITPAAFESNISAVGLKPKSQAKRLETKKTLPIKWHQGLQFDSKTLAHLSRLSYFFLLVSVPVVAVTNASFSLFFFPLFSCFFYEAVLCRIWRGQMMNMPICWMPRLCFGCYDSKMHWIGRSDASLLFKLFS